MVGWCFQWSWVHHRGRSCLSNGRLALGFQGKNSFSELLHAIAGLHVFLHHQINPIFGVVGVALLVLFCPNPPRGAAETHGEGVRQQSSYLEDIKYLMKM